MLDRDQIAHEYLLALMNQTNKDMNQYEGASLAYSIADAMIAEAQKRKNTERPAVIGDDWISVSDRLPEDRQIILVYRPEAHMPPSLYPNIKICEFIKSNQTGRQFETSMHDVTHWQPLPQAPK